MIRIFKKPYFWLLIIIILAYFARVYKIEYPIADWHSWRQVDTIAVTRNFIKEGFNAFLPKYDDMSGVSEYPVVNSNRFRFVEFPVYNMVTFPIYLLFGVNDAYSRLVSVFFSLGSIVFLFLICKRYLSNKISLLIAFFYSLLPFNIFFSRTTLPEPTFLFFALGMIYFIDKWIWERRKVWVFLGFAFIIIAFLIKPWAIFFVPPLIYSLIKKDGFKKSFKSLAFFSLALIPFIFWRFWILQQPEGIPASGWLMNGDHIRFRPAFWWWIVSERFGKEIFGVTGFVLFTIGLLMRPKNNYFFHVWFVSMFSYICIFATGNVRHDYYQYIIIPSAIVFFTLGFIYLIKGINEFIPRIFTILIALLFLPLSYYFSWSVVKGFYQINNPVIVDAGRQADKILPKNAIVLAPYNGDTAFLYHINRPGFSVTALPILELVSDFGVTHFVSTTMDEKTNWVLRHFNVLENNPKFVIVDLTKIINPFNEDREP